MSIEPTGDTPRQPVPYGGEGWDTLTSTADQFFGGELEKANALIGVPFVVVRLTYRIGDYMRPTGRFPFSYGEETGDYVSADLITAPEEIIEKRRAAGKIAETNRIEPDSHIVLNLSGTGAYRQLAEYLENKARLIVLPEGPDGGEFGNSRYDLPVRLWGIHNSVRVVMDQTTEPPAYVSAQFDIRLHCARGLRTSKYDNAHGKDIESYYLG